MTEFEAIYQRYAPKIFRVCMGYTNDAAQAQDLVQDTFYSAWRNLDKFRGQAHISTWLYRIATNHCLRALEVAKRMPEGELPEQLAEPEAAPEKDEQLNFLYQCISELPEADRIIISLELEDVPQAEIAQITGLSEVNVRVKIHRIKEKLSKKFKAHGKTN